MRGRFSILLVFVMVLTLVPSVPGVAASGGCAELNNPALDGTYEAPFGYFVFHTSFEAGETISITGSDVWTGMAYPPDHSPGYWRNYQPGETYEFTVPSDGTYWFTWRGAEQDWEVSCTSPDTQFIDSDTTLTDGYSGEIVIVADNVTLDCAGYSVTPAAVSEGVGILVSNRTGVTVTNCVVSGFQYDIFYVGSSYGTITNNVAYDASQGVALNTTDHTLVSGNEVYGTTTAGIGLADADGGNTITGNWAHDNSRAGIDLYLSDENTVAGNTTDVNGDFGILLNGADGNLVTGNTSEDNGNMGFFVTGMWDSDAVENTLAGNVASGNLLGFFLENAHDNALQENLASRNEHGFVLHVGSTGNTLRENTSLHNNLMGFYLLAASTGNELVENISEHNYIGFLFTEGSSGNTVSENTARTNHSWDAAQDNTSPNDYFENDFKSTIGF